MANPEHVPELDTFDRLTVVLYRSGLCIATVGVGLLALAPRIGLDPVALYTVVLLGAQLSAACMHLYDKRVRWIIRISAHLGAWLVVVGLLAQLPLVRDAGLGFGFVTLSAFALKERFCFRIPLLRAVPLFLATGLIPQVLGMPWGTTLLFGLATLPLGVLCVVKWRMPLHFDVGDKSAYQV